MDEKTAISLKEYETCQSHNNALGQQSWVSISILITVNLLVLAQIVSGLVLTTVPGNGWAKLILVILVGVVMIAILGIFKRWDTRITFLTLLNNERMRQIESELAMWKNWRAYGLDLKYGYGFEEDKKTLSTEQKKGIKDLAKRYPLLMLPWYKLLPWRKEKNLRSYKRPSNSGEFWKLRWKFGWIFYILISLWALVIILEILISSSSTISQWLTGAN